MEINKLKELLNKNNGYITTKEIEENIVSKTYIPELLKKGIIRKVAKGLYIDNNSSENFGFYVNRYERFYDRCLW